MVGASVGCGVKCVGVPPGFHSIAFSAGFSLPSVVGRWRRARVMVYFLCKVNFEASLLAPGFCFGGGVGGFGWGLSFQRGCFSRFACTMGGGFDFGSCWGGWALSVWRMWAV